MNIMQTPLEGKDDKRKVHTGFITAFRSVIDAAYHSLDLAVGKDGGRWVGGFLTPCRSVIHPPTHPPTHLLTQHRLGQGRVDGRLFRSLIGRGSRLSHGA